MIGTATGVSLAALDASVLGVLALLVIGQNLDDPALGHPSIVADDRARTRRRTGPR
jgi:hypothetical protein